MPHHRTFLTAMITLEIAIVFLIMDIPRPAPWQRLLIAMAAVLVSNAITTWPARYIRDHTSHMTPAADFWLRITADGTITALTITGVGLAGAAMQPTAAVIPLVLAVVALTVQIAKKQT